MCLKDKDTKPHQAAAEGDTSVIANSASSTIAVTCATTTPVIPTGAAAGAAKSDVNSGDSCVGETNNMTPDIVQDNKNIFSVNDCLVLVVRDLSSSAMSMPKKSFLQQQNSSVGSFLTAVSKHFLYEPNSFALTYQKSSGETIEINELPSEKCLGEIGFTVGLSNYNNLIITNLPGSTPRKIEEDDLGLGASASPTSSVSEIRPSTKWYEAPPISGNYETSIEATAGSSSRIKQDAIGYVGLVNQAMTCYLNSLLQTLFMTPEFRNALYRWEFRGSEEEAAKSIPYQLQKLFLLLQEEALRAFVEPELLTGNNQYECSKCESLCDAHKGLKFTRFPYLLTLHLKRFDFDYQTFHRIKLNDKVTFPNILDLNGFMEDTVKENIEGQDQNAASPGQTCSPDKCSAEKLDDASTTDSGSALDGEESSSVGFSTSNQASNDTDTQDEDEGIDVSSVYNEKNRLLCMSNGPYVYELFSIMVHSGSASGGHYYAYIKDLKTGEWFCFNDQSVSRITYDDIRKTYGGANSRGYYSSWTSSANAYMLMYRQADKERNVDIFSEEEFPSHIKELVQKMMTEEAAEREAREIERLMCKIKLFCPHPKAKLLLEKKFKVHKDTKLKDATKLAYQELKLEDVVPLERCRLVKYEEVHDSIECSFTNQDDEPISEVLGGVRSSYKFDLLMEIRDEDKEFEEYKPGGITVKVHTVNLETEEVEGPHIVRASQTQSVKEFKELLGRSLSLDPSKMRVVKEKYYNDHKPLATDTKLLKDEGFYRSNKVFVEASGIESPNFFVGSQLYSILDRYENTITIHCYLPERSPEVLEDLQIPPYNPKESLKPESQQESSTTSKPDTSEKSEPKINKSEAETPTTESTSTSLAAEALSVEAVKIQSSDSKPAKIVSSETSVSRESSVKIASGAEKRVAIKNITPPSTKAKNLCETDLLSNKTVSNTIPNVTFSAEPVPPSVVAKPKKEVKTVVKKKGAKSVALGARNVALNAPYSENIIPFVAPSSSNISQSSTISATTTTTTTKSITATETHTSVSSLHLRDASISSVSSTTVNLSDEEEAALPDGEVAVGSSSSTVNSDQSASEDSSLTSDSDRTLVGEQTEGNLFDLVPEYHNVSSPEDDPKVDLFNWSAPSESAPDPAWDDDEDTQSVKRYFRACLTEPDILRVSVDKRITIGQLKNELQKYVGVAEEHFKLYKYYMNSSHEFECTRTNETLYSYGDNNVMKIRLGRALLPDEFKGKVFLLDPSNSDDPAKFLIDFVIRKKESVAKVKAAMVKEVNSKCSMELDPTKMRLRKKSWKNPQTIFLDHQIFDDDIILYANWEFYLQILEGPEEKTDKVDELSVFLKWFHPSTYTADPLTEVILSTPTAEALSVKISEVSSIPVKNVEFAKGKGTFPCDMSAYEIPTDLDWSKKTGLLDKRPIYILDDGAVVYFKDSRETLKSLTESEKNELINEENTRLNRDYHSALTVVASPSVSTSSRSREKGLKIYLSQSSGEIHILFIFREKENFFVLLFICTSSCLKKRNAYQKNIFLKCSVKSHKMTCPQQSHINKIIDLYSGRKKMPLLLLLNCSCNKKKKDFVSAHLCINIHI
ncbi:Ubiquitin carboxyl-terminal hydrolase 47 [Armadillidium vulgare]|nr:Ubiquitin carboxyl-terminal hydrolase 47 [Armadillidium vulgare]